VTGVIDWSLVVLADPALDVGSTKTVLAYAPSGLSAPLAALVGAFQRNVLVRRYEAQYRARRDVDAAAVRYYEALRAFRSLVWAGESRRLAAGLRLTHARPGPWDAPPIARRLARHFRRVSGIELELPD
jgi:aminoglycoside phosphotransferase (APT) family kinase protein